MSPFGFVMLVITLIAVGVFTVFVLLVLLVDPGYAHMAETGWRYPIECCSKKDCKVYPAQNVKPGPDGWILHDGVVVPFDKVEPSPDGFFHRCDSSMGLIKRWDNGNHCFFVPGAQG